MLEVLADHHRRDEIRALLVELDPRNTALAAERALAVGLRHVEVVTADASLTEHYLGMVPADVVLVCGVFGNITEEDVERTVDACSQLCRTGGTVIRTRHRGAPDMVPLICEWFETRGFERQWLAEQHAGFGVGAHRFTGEPGPLVMGVHLFSFVGYDVLRQANGPCPHAIRSPPCPRQPSSSPDGHILNGTRFQERPPFL
ncbi:class I SAM-dependent methyltransferase [Streptomyces sp. NPDC057806]|uniref:class I SAM-dependent methyltransferase n=1 Tax=Streptomyces sp. NPDC057806 TaxID=3346255 RepID=UPI00367E90CD